MVECNSVDSAECNSHETSNLDNEQFRLNKIHEIKDYFIAEIRERELISKRLGKYIAFCDYSDKSVIVLSATSGSVSIQSLSTKRSKKKKRNKIIVLARSKLYSIESKISEALINNQISHEDFLTIINEEKNYRKLKESIRMMMLKVQENKQNRY